MTNNTLTSTNLNKQQRRALDPDFIKLAANDLITHKWLVEENTYSDSDDITPTVQTKVPQPFGRMEISNDEPTYEEAIYFEDQHGGQDINYMEEVALDLHSAPKGYGQGFDGFVQRARGGRHSERIVCYYLIKAGVVATLEPGVMDGDTSKKAPDIYVRAAQPDEKGDYQWYALEVKTTCLQHEFYTDEEDTFPSRIIVDSVKPYDEKRKKCNEDGTPLIGVVKIHSRSDGLLFIPDKTRDSWEIKDQHNSWKEDTVYVANSSCFRSFAALVKALGGKL